MVFTLKNNRKLKCCIACIDTNQSLDVPCLQKYNLHEEIGNFKPLKCSMLEEGTNVAWEEIACE